MEQGWDFHPCLWYLQKQLVAVQWKQACNYAALQFLILSDLSAYSRGEITIYTDINFSSI
jgi:hypothetical protein